MIWYVNAAAPKNGCGTKESPFTTISQAAALAVPGDEVLVAPGLYREYVDPKNGGTEEARIVYRSTEPLGAHITGAEEAKGWKLYQGTTWVLRVPNGVFGDYNPYTTYVYGDWYFSPVLRHTGSVYVNGQEFYEAETLDECLEGGVWEPSWNPAESVYRWYTEQDGDETVIYANFHDYDPNEEYVEINVRRRCFFPSETGRGYITFSGFTVSKAATTWAPPAAFQDGMVGPHWSKGWIIEDCDISHSKCCGISLGKYYDPDNDHYFTTKHVKSPTQMERDAVCRGQYHGWLKENIGHHIVRRCNIHNCEQTGIVGRMGCVFSIIEDNHIHHINNMQQLGGAEIAGIKFHAAIDVIFRRNHIHHCTMGIWCDWQAQGTRITGNILHDNQRPDGVPELPGGMMSQDIFVEVSHGPTLIDNNILLSRASLRIATEGVAMVHNLICGALTAVGGGTDQTANGKNQPRYTPYHIAHRTEVMGFMIILHGDDRFYNNIFVQRQAVRPAAEKEDMGFRMADNEEVGTHVFNDYPTYDEWIKRFDIGGKADMRGMQDAHFDHLPVWVEGNAYLAGAKPNVHETHNLVNDFDAVTVEVTEDGKLITNVFELVQGFTAPIITSDTLGKAFEPEERFENPDGTAITFDTDYFGAHRGLTAMPGPFADAAEAERKLW